MVELLLTYLVKFVELGIAYYLIHSLFSKKTKKVHLSIDQNGIEVDSTFYEDQHFFISKIQGYLEWAIRECVEVGTVTEKCCGSYFVFSQNIKY